MRARRYSGRLDRYLTAALFVGAELQLVLGDATAKTHVDRILQKLGLCDRVQAVSYGYARGIVVPGPP